VGIRLVLSAQQLRWLAGWAYYDSAAALIELTTVDGMTVTAMQGEQARRLPADDRSVPIDIREVVVAGLMEGSVVTPAERRMLDGSQGRRGPRRRRGPRLQSRHLVPKAPRAWAR
jgi:hypothetical protein